jgi:plasmid stabilization system protein ParE
MKPVRLTRRAEARLTEIAAWTTERFGPRQAKRLKPNCSIESRPWRAARP